LARAVRAALAGLALLAAGTANPAAAAKDELVVGLTQFPSSFHPAIDAMLVKAYILAMTRKPLTAYDAQWKLICMLCTELPTIENGKARLEDLPDGKHGIAVTFTIQPNAAWGDGVPVTTDDVVFAWQVGTNAQSGVADSQAYRRITAIDVVDAKTFTVHEDKVHYDYNALTDFELLPAHLDRTNFAEPAAYLRRTAYETDTTNPGLYYGPYRITQVSRGAQVVLEANPTWYGRKPYFKRIIVRSIENTAALEANLLSGGIDYIAGELGMSVDQALAFEKRHGDQFKFVYKPGLIYEHIDLNLDNPILKDKRVRQALLYALDREAITRQLFAGKDPVAGSFVSPLDWTANPDLPRYAYDPAKATALLDAAGWSDIKDGWRVNAHGQRLALELTTTAGNRTRETVEVVLQNQWKKLGIDVRLRNEPARVLVGETLRQRKFPGMVMLALVSSPEETPREELHSSAIPTAENNYTGQNDTGFRNADADSVIDRLEGELDRDKRRALWYRLQEIYMDELPVLPLYFRADVFVMPKWLAGIEPTGHEYGTTFWVENWRAE
jgi:peptide/nickel transport system substrate-binding protein